MGLHSLSLKFFRLPHWLCVSLPSVHHGMDALDIEEGAVKPGRKSQWPWLPSWPPWLFRLLRFLLTLLTPYVLLVGSARLVTSEWFLYVEYSRANFPKDRFGFAVHDRMNFGKYCIVAALRTALRSNMGD
eukprot:Skav213717  [mRNA]  locus=scaffold2678:150682:153737:- [translate_table: standard]